MCVCCCVVCCGVCGGATESACACDDVRFGIDCLLARRTLVCAARRADNVHWCAYLYCYSNYLLRRARCPSTHTRTHTPPPPPRPRHCCSCRCRPEPPCGAAASPTPFPGVTRMTFLFASRHADTTSE
ncbi:hypothetical protein ABB37_05179 [Leptomonas pyrrhocoris]|nr:hypothetical protein ABB37_05179 [Leptomonas pyrrhocoris]KPA80199.1 hypothetical protein ABB37_05179 [Leptomonas pyrrhocoris]|eukprot:XP_015658638.1 hypothetical protein ABB37_05179 [Leptomonas pyrrhocoris]